VKKRQFAWLLGISILSLTILFSACRKINEATELGGDLIPVVDNITTFDTTLTVETYNGIFDPLVDSTRLGGEAVHYLGHISNDPIFGQTDGRIFVQLKPNFYRFAFANKPDSLHIDSVVLVLEYAETYGDTNSAQSVNVFEIDQSSVFRVDSVYPVTRNNFTYSNLLGSKTFFPYQLNDTTYARNDTTINRLRIRLADAFGQRLLNYDSTFSASNGAYYSDSAFNSHFKGFAIVPSGGGNAIMGFDLGGVKTKLAIYYKDDNNQDGNPSKWDTLQTDFNFTVLSASANYVTRTHHPDIVTSANNATQDDIVYVQNIPGTYSTIKIPGLGGLSNRIVHRAELIMEQIFDASDTMFTTPTALMLDAYDPAISKFRTIPYDMTPDAQGALTPYYFGGLALNTLDDNGKTIKTWKFNISRYVQHVVNETLPAYDLRVFSPYYVDEQYGIPGTGADIKSRVFVNPTIARGRVRLNGGSPDSNPRRMRLRIIYSKI
jgi:hypothetical protein